MIQAPNLNTKTVNINLAAIAACMDELAVQIVESADTLSSSEMCSVRGNSIAQTVSSMKVRAEKIRDITAEFRTSGDMASFEAACKLAGWKPDQHALAALQAVH